MAPKQTRLDARTLTSEHGGRPYTITMTSPRIKADGTPIDKHIESARKVGTVEQTTIVAGFVTPASFRIDGLSRPVTFETGIRSPLGGGLTITTLTIDHDRSNAFGMNQLADNDLPNFSTLLRHALTISTCLVKVKASPPMAVGSPITPAMFAGTVIKVGSGHISPTDRLRALGKPKQASDKDAASRCLVSRRCVKSPKNIKPHRLHMRIHRVERRLRNTLAVCLVDRPVRCAG